MIVAVPSAIAVTNPADETVATDEFDVTHVTVGFEITLPSNPLRLPTPEHVPLPTFPAIERDLALVVPIDHTAAELDLLIRNSGGELLESLEMFDLYFDPENDNGVRSLAFRLRFRSADRTLKDKEVDNSVDLILRRLKEELDVEPRG